MVGEHIPSCPPEAGGRRDDRHTVDDRTIEDVFDADPISGGSAGSVDGVILTDGGKLRGEYCDEEFDPTETSVTRIPSAILYHCPNCGRWTEGPPPG